MKTVLALGALALLIPQQARAEDTLGTGLLGLLTLNTASGETKVNGEAGQLEAWAIVGRMMDSAAAKVWEDTAFNSDTNDKKILLLGGSETFDPSPFFIVESRIRFYNQSLDAIAGSPRKCAGGGRAVVAGSDASPNVLQALAGALRQDRDLVGVIVEPSERMWLNAVAGHGVNVRKKSILFANTLVPDPLAEVATDWVALRQQAATLGREKCLAGNAALKKLTAQIADADKEMTAAESGKQSLLEKAAALESLVTSDLLILRPSIEKAGGTLITTKNLLTAFGMPSVTMSGGMVLSYRVEQWTEPKLDTYADAKADDKTKAKAMVHKPLPITVLSAGTVVCQRPMSRLSTINKLVTIETGCSLIRSLTGSNQPAANNGTQ